nr:MAG TPA: head tail connector [Caudoviricetes sp.]
MNNITSIYEITSEDVAEYLHLDDFEENEQFLNNILRISKEYIKNYTGRKESELANYADFIIVVFALCQDMYDNRTMYVDKSNINNVVKTILDMHSVNLL